MKKVYVAGNPLEAHMVRDFLESAGIEAIVRGEHLFALRGGVPMTEDTLPSVWLVHEERYVDARHLIEQLQARAHFRVVRDQEAAPDEEDDDDTRELETGA